MLASDAGGHAARASSSTAHVNVAGLEIGVVYCHWPINEPNDNLGYTTRSLHKEVQFDQANWLVRQAWNLKRVGFSPQRKMAGEEARRLALNCYGNFGEARGPI